ncbi:hypothetical protein TSUD_321690 [Trifolium subterraneum]|uniref:Uncharacterized protein n=1 Tax=Trifolium subterraneum TaxID=3900 RepID=A0A2Z6NIT2_TRISU|nr:hypothetical protein TSUD_321690 [Trifolium subterraneum]
MTSSVIENGHDDGSKHEPSDLIAEKMNPTVVNLSLPNETFLKAAISLKDEVVEVTWKRREVVVDPTVYTGLLGTAFTCLRSYEVTGSHEDLVLCSEIIDTCATVAHALAH